MTSLKARIINEMMSEEDRLSAIRDLLGRIESLQRENEILNIQLDACKEWIRGLYDKLEKWGLV